MSIYVYTSTYLTPSQVAKNIPMPPWIGTEQQLLQLSRSEKLCVFTETVVLVCDKVERFSWFFSVFFCITEKKHHTVDGSEIPNSHLGFFQKPVNNGINYLPTGAGFLPSTIFKQFQSKGKLWDITCTSIIGDDPICLTGGCVELQVS